MVGEGDAQSLHVALLDRRRTEGARAALESGVELEHREHGFEVIGAEAAGRAEPGHHVDLQRGRALQRLAQALPEAAAAVEEDVVVDLPAGDEDARTGAVEGAGQVAEVVPAGGEEADPVTGPLFGKEVGPLDETARCGNGYAGAAILLVDLVEFLFVEAVVGLLLQHGSVLGQ